MWRFLFSFPPDKSGKWVRLSNCYKAHLCDEWLNRGLNVDPLFNSSILPLSSGKAGWGVGGAFTMVATAFTIG